ncbi:TolB family protein [Pendulispora albinea]|uniref:DUF5050 domain-containing protein n=1 Tax=Pendulispora albinea TaxID=2741071 RepID=A0ABZ2LSW0_9BACT
MATVAPNALVALVALSSISALGCDEAKRKQELTAATQSSASVTATARPAASAQPEPEKPHARTVLARFKKPKGLAVDGSSAFVMDAVSGDKEQNEVLDLLRVNLSAQANPGAGAEPVHLASKLRAAGTPLVIKGESFFAVGGDKPNGVGDRLMKAGTSAPSTPVQVAPKALALADPAVASNGASNGATNGATDGASLFYLAPADDKTLLDVMRVPLAGGKPVRVASGGRSARVLFVAADSKYVYWPEAGRLMKAPVGGGASSEVAKVVYAWAAVSDGNHLYWSDSPGDNMGTIRRIKIDGGEAETLTSGFSFPVGLALDDKSVFFVNYDSEDGGVYRVPKAGGSAVTLIRGQKHPKRIAVDDRHVYWINVGEGTLSQADK